MPHFLTSEPVKAILVALGDALDLVDVAVVLLNRDLRVRFINQRGCDILNVPTQARACGLTYPEIVAHGKAAGWFAMEPDEPAPLPDDSADGPTQLHLNDGRRLLSSCVMCADGGRILTYADVSTHLQREVGRALEVGCADMRFQNETLESQAAYLASLAEATDEGARAVEAARLALEHKMAEQRQLEAELRRLANIDGLTGALNRATFMKAAQDVLEQGRNLTALMLDVDHFKMINDRFGHAAGDHALRQLVAVLQTEIREQDLLGRLGGEEFALVLSVRSPDEAAAVAERLRLRVAEKRLVFGSLDFSMTVSVGVAVRESSQRRIDEVIAAADAALYQAKAAGRNRVVMAQQPHAA